MQQTIYGGEKAIEFLGNGGRGVLGNTSSSYKAEEQVRDSNGSIPSLSQVQMSVVRIIYFDLRSFHNNLKKKKKKKKKEKNRFLINCLARWEGNNPLVSSTPPTRGLGLDW